MTEDITQVIYHGLKIYIKAAHVAALNLISYALGFANGSERALGMLGPQALKASIAKAKQLMT
jgi:hypothetical protein